MKYELIAEGDLFRLRAVKDFAGVRKGDRGGLVEGEWNLSQDGTCWIGDDARVTGQARVSERAQVYGEARVCEYAMVYGQAQVGDGAWVFGSAAVTGQAWVYGRAQVFGGACVYGGAEVTGRAQVYERARVYGHARVYGSAWVHGTARVSGSARVSGTARVERNSHALYLSGLESGPVNMFRTADGYHLSIGCWMGSTDDLREMIAGDVWPVAEPPQQEERRPALMALADMVDAIARSWEK